MSHFIEAFIFLACAVLIVPLFRPLGTVIGYLFAGLLVGPYGFGLVSHVDEIREISKLGVVLLLFIIGLELEPKRLWSLRNSIFGLGGIQVLLTGLVILFPLLFSGNSISVSFTIAFALALSSTAFALQLLTERNQLISHYGKYAFSILLFQDLALIPLLAFLPMLVTDNNFEQQVTYGPVLSVIGLAFVIVVGVYVTRPLFRFVARSRNTEVFTATTLLVAIGTAFVVSLLGMPMSLGAFLAGVVLADSEFKHEIESHIAPFKALLLGLFFMVVGMSLNWRILVDNPGSILSALLCILLIKLCIFYLLGRISKLSRLNSCYLAAVLSQGGEFAFVLFSHATTLSIMSQEQATFWGVVVTLSMLTTPFLLLLIDRVLAPRLQEYEKDTRLTDSVGEKPVIIAGFGRFGQDVAQILTARDIGFTAIEKDFDMVSYARADGNVIYYGDATKPELLKSVKADQAQMIVVAVDNIKISLQIVATVNRYFPHLKVFARAHDQSHLDELSSLEIEGAVRETYLSSLETSRMVMNALGLPFLEADKTVREFQVKASVHANPNQAKSNHNTKPGSNGKSRPKDGES